MDLRELESFRLEDAVKFHDSLNPQIWGPDEQMLPAVRERLLAIADDFRESLGIDVEVKDITISGSNAAYTYTPHSDIDLHLVADLPQADESDIYRELFDAKKYQYNDEHDFRIGPYDVELYVQDASKPHYSQGIYSIRDDRWLSVPKRRKPEVNDISVRSKYEDMGARIDAAIDSGDLIRMDALAKKIRDMRQTGLETTGEFGPENLAFKVLRNNGTMNKLKQARLAAKDREMSLNERRKKKRGNKKKWGVFGGYYYPGFGYYPAASETGGDSDGGDGGGGEGREVRESREMDLDTLLKDFVKFCSTQLGLEDAPRIRIKRDPQWSRANNTFGRYVPEEHTLYLSVANRHPLDIMRTMAHELTHHRQAEVEPMPDEAGETGSRFENQANAMAGIIMRKWADLHPDMFDQPITENGGDEDTGDFPNQSGGKMPGEPIPYPKGTVKVDVSDVYDWYKIGQHISDLKGLGHHDFGKGPPQTVLSFGSEPVEHKYIQDLAKLGLTTTDIDESLRGKLGAAAAAACVAGAPGCATTDISAADALRTVQTVGRIATNPPTRAGAEEELRQELKNILNRGRGTHPEPRIKEADEPLMKLDDPIVNYDIPYSAIARPERLYQARRFGRISHYGSPAASAAIISVPVSKERAFVDTMRNLSIPVKKSAVYEASGYIPTEKERNDPRFKMALTRDIRPGQTGKEANKLGLKTDSQGRPQLLMKRLANLLEETKLDEKCWTGYRKQGMKKKGEEDVDEDGDTDTTDFLKWFGRSQAVDARGRPQIMYHGSATGDIEQFQPGRGSMIFFGPLNVARSFGPNIYPAYLRVVKPFRGDQHFATISNEIKQNWKTIAREVAKAQSDAGVDEPIDSYADVRNRILGLDYFVTEESDTLRQIIQRAGFDAIMSDESGELIYGVFSPDQIRPARDTLAEACWTGYRKQGMKRKGDRMVPNCVPVNEEEDLFEVKMSPGELRRWAESPEAEGIRAGFEAEMIFRDTSGGDSEDYEPDYEMDERARDIDEVLDFFRGGEGGISGGMANRLRESLYEEYIEWRETQIYNEWENQAEEQTRDYMETNVWGDDSTRDQYRERAAEDLGIETSEESAERAEEIEARAREFFDEDVEQSIEDEDRNYDDAREYFRDMMVDGDDFDQSDWFRNEYPYMSDVAEGFGLDWPYYTGGREGTGERSIDDIAQSLNYAIDMPVVASSNYHATSRRPGRWIIEPDGSLDPDEPDDELGLEIVSPPMPLPETLRKLQQVIDWANGDGNAYTNSSTGLHMGMSIPFKGGNVDYVKLILFMGDQYVLDKFDRMANTYCASALDKLRQTQTARRRGVRENVRGWDDEPAGKMTGAEKTAAAMDLMRKNLIELAQGLVQDGVGLSKYTSAHIKDGYIEFRSPGGDYLSLDSREDQALEDTMLRFARAMYIAGRPDLERKEYSKKLYKLLSGFRSAETAKDTKRDTRYRTHIETEDQNDAMDLFAKYSSGMINAEELKKQWAEQVLSKEAPPQRSLEDGKEYEVVRQDTGEVIDIIRDWTLASANETALVKYSGKGFDFFVRVKDTEPEKKLSRRAQVAKRIKERPSIWRVTDTNTGRSITVAADGTQDAKYQARLQDPEFQKLFYNDPDSMLVEPASAEEAKQFIAQYKDMKQDSEQVQQRVQGSPGRYRVRWTERRGEREAQDSLTVDAANADAAMAAIRHALEVQGRDIISIDAALAGSTQDLQQQRAQQSGGEFTGRWNIQDALSGEVLHTISGIGNNQGDANRHAREWIERTGYSGAYEIVPEMR